MSISIESLEAVLESIVAAKTELLLLDPSLLPQEGLGRSLRGPSERTEGDSSIDRANEPNFYQGEF